MVPEKVELPGATNMSITFRKIMKAPIWLYSTLISPYLPKSCRYYPSCSLYTSQALEKHGFWKGLYLGIIRILNCHPFSRRSFHDPVPEQFTWPLSLRYKQRNKKQQETRADAE